MATTLPVEIKFAQHLAGNEQKHRFRALKKLKKYLRAKSSPKKDGFTKEDLLKIWKGLHYCMWMQDKPVMQEELALTLTRLVHEMTTFDMKMLFIKVFFITEAREWGTIDVWRIDKFMMMVRSMLSEALIIVRKLDWATEPLDTLMQVFCDFVMNPYSEIIPDGLKVHFADIYLQEVEKVGGEQLSGAQLVKLLDPFIKFIQAAKRTDIIQRVVREVFEPICQRAVKLLEIQGRPLSHTEDGEEEEDDVPFSTLQFDLPLLADHMFTRSQEKCVINRNRGRLYNLLSRLRDLAAGVIQKPGKLVIEDGVSHRDMQLAVNSLVRTETSEMKERVKYKKQKHTFQLEVSEDSNLDANNNNDPEGAPGEEAVVQDTPSTSVVSQSKPSKKKAKRKHSKAREAQDGEPLTKIKKKAEKAEQPEKTEASEDTGAGKTKLRKIKEAFKGKSKKNKSVTVGANVDSNKTPELTRAADSSGSSAEKSGGGSGKGGKSKLGQWLKKDKSKGDTTPRAGATTVQALIPEGFRVTTPGEATPSVNPDTSADKQPKKGKKLFGKAEVGKANSDTPVAPSQKSGKTASTGKTPVSGKKRKAPAIVVTSHSPAESQKTPDTQASIHVTTTASASNSFTPSTNSDTTADTPSKKAKKTPGSVTRSTFAQFDSSKPPVAYVKKSVLNKTPSTKSAPGSAKSKSDNKKVIFNMKKNKAQGFKESLNSPLTPFNPNKKPDQGILKSPGNTPLTAGTINRKSPKNSTGTPPTPKSQRVINRVKAKSQRRASMPVMSIGVAKQPHGKPATPMRRAKAADFFL